MNNIKTNAVFSCGAAAVAMNHTVEPTAFDKAWAPISRWYARWTGAAPVAQATVQTVVAQPARRNHAA